MIERPYQKTGKFIKCKTCNKSFYIARSRYKTKKYCSKKCHNISKIGLIGSKANHWKGGQYKNVRGYVFIYKPNHPFCNKTGYVKRANLVMEKHIGRYLIPPELVHHKKALDNDRIEHLQLFPNHSKHLSKK